uniref:Cytochrome P450 720B n=1 Tax=Pinus elliottii TaxID=42064 RepID=A0A9E8AAF3_PINEL|nr:cytochrome P450 720B [Pinus elliottii]
MADQISLLLVVFTAAVALLHLIYRWWNAQTGQRKTHTEKNQAVHLPPGSTGWPLIGETYSYYRSMSSNRPRQFIDDREKRYDSDIFVSHLFGSQAVVSADPQFNKYVLQNEGRLFQAQYPKALKALMGDCGLLSVHGNLQRKLHGIAVNLLSFERLKFDFMVEIQNLVHSTLDRWVDEKEIFLQNECHQMVLNLMAKQLLDLSPSKETNEICKLFVDYTNAMIAIPIKIPGSTYAKGLKEEHDVILKAKGGHKKLEWDDYKSMKFTQCVINETLRLGNFSLAMFRETKEDIKVKDILIPKGWVVCVFSSATHLDEKFHNEALTFNPWRWELDQDVSNNHLFSPFGGGARLCPGSHLARLELALFLHIFITRFRWEALDDEHPSYFPLPYLAKGFPMRLYNRE